MSRRRARCNNPADSRALLPKKHTHIYTKYTALAPGPNMSLLNSLNGRCSWPPTVVSRLCRKRYTLRYRWCLLHASDAMFHKTWVLRTGDAQSLVKEGKMVEISVQCSSLMTEIIWKTKLRTTAWVSLDSHQIKCTRTLSISIKSNWGAQVGYLRRRNAPYSPFYVLEQRENSRENLWLRSRAAELKYTYALHTYRVHIYTLII